VINKYITANKISIFEVKV